MDELHQDNDPLLTVEEVAEFLRVPKTWIYEHTRPSSRSPLPHVKLGKYLRFRRTDIEEFLKQVDRNHVAHGTSWQ